MSLQWPKSGPNDLSSYALPGIPWVTSSALAASEVRRIAFPCVTKFLYIRNLGNTGSIAVGFSDNGVRGNPAAETHYMTLGPTSSLPILELRIKDLFLRAIAGTPAFEVVAGLSTVEYSHFPVLTGSVDVVNEPFNGIG